MIQFEDHTLKRLAMHLEDLKSFTAQARQISVMKRDFKQARYYAGVLEGIQMCDYAITTCLGPEEQKVGQDAPAQVNLMPRTGSNTLHK